MRNGGILMNTTEEFDYEEYTRQNAPDPSQIRRGPEEIKRRRETFKARLVNHNNMEIKRAREMRHVFISYCHENKTDVSRICNALTSNGVNVWVDWNNITPGIPWKQAIQYAINHGDFFIACFSKEYNSRDKTYMSKELSIAIERLQQKPHDKTWFIPVKLNDCDIPTINIDEGDTLKDLEYIDLYENWETGIQQILGILPIKSSETIGDQIIVDNDCVLFRSVDGQYYFIPFQEIRWDSKEITLTLSPNADEQAAFLCSLRRGKHDLLAFAHLDDAIWVKPREVTQVSCEGKTTWEVILNEDTTGKTYKHRTEKPYLENISLDQISLMRAKRLLLDEKLEKTSKSLGFKTVFDKMLLETQIRGELSSQYGNRLQALTSPIPEIYKLYRTKPETFIRFTRLISILHLKLTNTVEDVMQLDLKLINPTALQVKFKGRRSWIFVNDDPATIEFEGICSLPE